MTADLRAARRLPRGVAAVLPWLLLSWALTVLPAGPVRAASGAEGAAAAGWSADTRGDFGPPATLTVQAAQDALAAQFVLPPGRSATWEKTGEREVRAGEKVEIAFSCDRANRSSSDYREGKARFPVSVTFLFGKDAADPPPGKKGSPSIWRRIGRAFAGKGIRIVYALGNDAPAGSMYRLGEEKTVFLLGGGEGAGGSAAAPRDLAADFQAAYGRPPRGPVTEVTVSVDRPSGEEGPMTGSISVRLPFQF